MKDSNNFFKTVEDQQSGWLWNGKTNKMLGEKNVEIENKVFNITPDIQKVFINTTEGLLKELENEDQVNFLDMMENIGFF